MSRMSELAIDIQEDLEKGILSFAEIARKYEVPASFVEDTEKMVIEFNQSIMENDYMDDY